MAMQPKTDFDIVIIGGGIIGLASAHKLAQHHPTLRLAVLEKESRLAVHQTGHNSGVIHSGLYYKPGSSKAKTCTAGREELIGFARRNDIAHEICGKIIVATDPKELPALEKILQNGRANGVEGLEKIGPERIREIEPFVSGVAALWVPSAGIIDFTAVVEKLAELVQWDHPQNKVLTSHRVTGFDKHDFYTNVVTDRGPISTRYVINCAGLQSDRVARMDGVDAGVRIVPFRGDYVELTPQAAEKVNNLIYPVPDPAFPFLGVHFTRMIAGGVECGPSAVFAFKREGYTKIDFSVADTWDALSHWGTWRLFLRHWRYGLGEYARTFSRKLLLKQLQRLVPSVTLEDLRPGNAGVRAQALGPRGQLVDDFKIEAASRAIHVLNAPSPAATASLAIGEHIHDVATQQFGL
jgi:(S)-2-hydroxyglutarate dehydrogenase